jgi:hypothetical protein
LALTWVTHPLEVRQKASNEDQELTIEDRRLTNGDRKLTIKDIEDRKSPILTSILDLRFSILEQGRRVKGNVIVRGQHHVFGIGGR